jgi:hypothetical protein
MHVRRTRLRCQVGQILFNSEHCIILFDLPFNFKHCISCFLWIIIKTNPKTWKWVIYVMRL